MIKKLRHRFKHWNSIRILRTLILRLRTHSRNIVVYNDVVCNIAKSATLNLSGRLDLGRSWPLGRHYPSQLVMDVDSVLTVKGNFSIYTDCDIWLYGKARLTLGSGYINFGARISCFDEIEIGDNTLIGENVTIRDCDNHYIDASAPLTGKIKIGNHVWIGMGATILKGVTIGDGAVVASGAVVIHNVPAYTLVAGIPAQIKKTNISWK